MGSRCLAASNWLADGRLARGTHSSAMHIHRDAGGLDTRSGPQIQGGYPNQQAQLRSLVNLPWHWQWTSSAYFVGRLSPADPVVHPPGYRIWGGKSRNRISLNLVGQNLLKGLHQEYSGPDLTVTFEPDPAERLCQAHVAVLNGHDGIGIMPAVPGARCVPASWRTIRCLSLLAFVSLFPAGAGKRTGAQTAAEEYRVKAAFIFHFAQLVDWPPEKANGQFAGSVHSGRRPISGVARRARWPAKQSGIGSFAFGTLGSHKACRPAR